MGTSRDEMKAAEAGSTPKQPNENALYSDLYIPRYLFLRRLFVCKSHLGTRDDSGVCRL